MKKFIPLFLLSFFLFGCSSLKKMQNNHLRENSFSTDQSQLIMQSDISTPMRVLKINAKVDSVILIKKSEDVFINPDDIVLQTFLKRLLNTVKDSLSLGVGIAAPQVGILKNIIWVQRFDKESKPFEVYLNPKIIQYSKMKQDCMEGCLSVPDERENTNIRSYAILIEYDKFDGTHKIEMIEDFTAVIFQHEIDHLNGILFIDHLEN